MKPIRLALSLCLFQVSFIDHLDFVLSESTSKTVPSCLDDGSHLWGDVVRQVDGCCIHRNLSLCASPPFHYDNLIAKDYSDPAKEGGGTSSDRSLHKIGKESECESFERWRPLFVEDVVKNDVIKVDQRTRSQYIDVYSCKWKLCHNNGWKCEQLSSNVTLISDDGRLIAVYHLSACDCGQINRDRRDVNIDEANQTDMHERSSFDENCDERAVLERSLTMPRAVVAESPYKWKYVDETAIRMKKKGTIGDEIEAQKKLAESTTSNMIYMPPVFSSYLGCVAYGGSQAFVGDHGGISGSGVAQKCHFPFKYHGVWHNACIKHDDSQHWCPTSVDDNGNYLPGHWGYCSAACPIELYECRTIEGGPAVGAICRFPFIYREIQFWRCTSLDSDRPWCATQTDGHGFMLGNQWGRCDCLNSTIGAPNVLTSTERPSDDPKPDVMIVSDPAASVSQSYESVEEVSEETSTGYDENEYDDYDDYDDDEEEEDFGEVLNNIEIEKDEEEDEESATVIDSTTPLPSGDDGGSEEQSEPSSDQSVVETLDSEYIPESVLGEVSQADPYVALYVPRGFYDDPILNDKI